MAGTVGIYSEEIEEQIKILTGGRQIKMCKAIW